MTTKAEEYKKMKEIVDQSRAHRQEILDKGAELAKFVEARPHTPSAPAEFAAKFLVECDAAYGVGSQLQLEWTLDYYCGMEFKQRVYPLIQKIEKKLEVGREVELFRGSVELIRPGVIVIRPEDEPWWLMIDNPGYFDHRYGVRSIWSETKKEDGWRTQLSLADWEAIDFELKFRNSPRFYGDCRDIGHIMTYEWMIVSTERCDHAMWNISDILRWFLEVNFVSAELCE